MSINQSITTLIVDDNGAVLKAVAALFKRLGCDVKTASGGNEALQAISETHFDLLVTDFDMPELNGCELATAVKHDAPETKVLIMTGMERSEVIGEINTGLADGWLFKPFDTSKIVSLLGKIL